MATRSVPRVRIPAEAKRGEIIEIKTLISHDMENGQRKDADGKVVPRKIINRFEALFNGKLVFTADWFPSVAANPYQSFYLKAIESGEFRFVWHDDDGSEYATTAKLTVV